MVSSQNVLKTPKGKSFLRNEPFRKTKSHEIGTSGRFEFSIFFLWKTKHRRIGFELGKFANTIFVFCLLGFVFPLSWIYPEVIPFEAGSVTEEEKKKTSLMKKNSGSSRRTNTTANRAESGSFFFRKDHRLGCGKTDGICGYQQSPLPRGKTKYENRKGKGDNGFSL